MPVNFGYFTRAVLKRARRGLYHGKRVFAGNNVSEKGGNKTRRTWKPNVQKCTLYSSILEKRIQVKVSTTALRTIERLGGLDEYILNTPDKKLDSDFAMNLKAQLKEREAIIRNQIRNAGVPAAAQPLIK